MTISTVGGDLGWSELADLSLGERDTADPLGFRAVANRVAADLVPVVTQSIGSVRGFSLLCLGLYPRTSHPVDKNEKFLRVERLYMAASVQPVAESKGVPQFNGVRVGRELIRSNKCFLDRPILSRQMSSGIWGSYSRAARELGLIKQGSRPKGTHITNTGIELAEVLRGFSIEGQTQPLGKPKQGLKHGVQTWITAGQLEKIARRLKPVTSRELELVSTAFSSLERSEHLYRLMKQKRRLATFDLDATKLTEQQESAWHAALALHKLMKRVEEPYRKWVVGESNKFSSSKPAKQLWKQCYAWDTDHSLRRLQERFSSKNTADSLHEWHQQLMAERGSSSWQQGVPDEGRADFDLPDFRLGALHQLFEEGLEIKP